LATERREKLTVPQSLAGSFVVNFSSRTFQGIGATATNDPFVGALALWIAVLQAIAKLSSKPRRSVNAIPFVCAMTGLAAIVVK